MRILVTGASGFVGRHFVKLAGEAGHEIAAAVHETEAPPEVNAAASCVTDFDIRDPEQCRRLISEVAPTAVVHLAGVSSVGVSWRRPFEAVDINVGGTVNLLRALNDSEGCEVALLVGSAEAYGREGTDADPLVEDDALRPLNPYGGSKAAQEFLALGLSKLMPCRMVMTRSFPHSGPGQERPFVLPDWASQLIEMRERPHPLQVGNVEVVRDILDVRDVAAAYLALLETADAQGIFNVSSGKGHRLLDVLHELGRIADVPLEIEVDETRLRPDEVLSLVGSPRKLEAATGWSTTYDLRTTLQDLVASVEVRVRDA